MARVTIVGSGPAGASAALYLARAGCAVTVLEAQHGAKSKVCGEGLMPAGAPVLDELGVLRAVLAAGARPFKGIRYRSVSGHSAIGAFPRWSAGVRGLAMPRAVLDGALRDALRAEPNVTLREGWVAAVEAEGDRVTGVRAREREGGREERLAADLTIGADGLRSRFHHLPGVDPVRPARRRFGLSAHLTGVEGMADVVEVHLVPGGELYLTPEGPDAASLAMLLDETAVAGVPPARVFADVLARADELSRRCAGATLTDEPRLMGPLGLTVSRAFGPGWMLAGDAAGALDPITGEGVALGLIAAQALGRAVATHGVTAEACRAALAVRARAMRKLELLTGALLFCAHRPALADAGVWAVSRLPGLFSRLLGVAAACPRPAAALAMLPS